MTSVITQSLLFDYSINKLDFSTGIKHSNQSCLIGILYTAYAIMKLRKMSGSTSINFSNGYSSENFSREAK
jgi:hypothetical protein